MRRWVYSANRRVRASPVKYSAVPHVHVATTFCTRGTRKADAGPRVRARVRAQRRGGAAAI